MNIVGRQLTLNENAANGLVECIARCHVALDLWESAGLGVPGNPGFTLRCVLESVDQNPQTNHDVLFTYPRSKTFTSVVDLINTDHVFTENVSEDLLNEDANGRDEVRARFTLMNNATGRSVTRRSKTVSIVV